MDPRITLSAAHHREEARPPDESPERGRGPSSSDRRPGRQGGILPTEAGGVREGVRGEGVQA
eukprot:29374-Pelagococcus_subviridis.AAC.3